MTDFSNIMYLKSGNPKQILAYKDLKENKIMELLSEFDPLLVGTIPINIDIVNSDLDIICFWSDKTQFISEIQKSFGNKKDFKIWENIINQQETVIASFLTSAFEIEIFGQNVPTKEQNGYKHMIIEHQILEENGDDFRREIIKLKKDGLKTEPAFAQLLGLKGNPYLELLNYKF
ncbi:uncharacterized protein DUF4269 [Flavobacterium cutihirudinis]|uniref:Uncharacterized protein DUF4269 n=1 Tax=Flavobacterium cutihirudinis TaxID=1265740 RepID=A0A3D9FPT8_9FLAO|nr:DUF4269 domain-containing protein [Flavobacterium cutihirudinis]RED22498.1 uncharacterized protein DUF4269 [Flavobacterium cutihirudinis]